MDGIKIDAFLDSGANSIINPRVMANMPTFAKLDVLDNTYQCLCCTLCLLSESGLCYYPCDCDFPLVLGADFLLDNQVRVLFNRKGGHFCFDGNKL